jgi:hypothetical protein
MHTFQRFLLCSCLVCPVLLEAQVWDRPARDQFARQVSSVSYWVHVEGDSMFEDIPVLDEIVGSELESRGYTAQKVSFSPGDHLSVSKWKQDLLSHLDSSGAFAELSFKVFIDSSFTASPGITHLYVADPGTGAGLLNTPRASNEPAQEVHISFQAVMQLYYTPIPGPDGEYHPVVKKETHHQFSSPMEVVHLLLEHLPRRIPSGESEEFLPQFSASTPKAEFAFYGGYLFPTSIDVKGGTADFYGDWFFGLEIGLAFTRNLDLLVSFNRQNTQFDLNSTKSQREDGPVKLSQNYLLVGCNYNFRLGKTWTLYAGALLGGVNLVPKDEFYRNVWYFDIQGQAGAKVYFLKWLGVRAQIQTGYEIHPEGAPFLYSDTPTYYPIPAYSNMFQWGGCFGILFRVGAGWR